MYYLIECSNYEPLFVQYFCLKLQRIAIQHHLFTKTPLKIKKWYSQNLKIPSIMNTKIIGSAFLFQNMQADC